jgi:hypothetical protein
MREVRDGAGTVWTVFDVIPSTNRRALSQVKPGYGSGWLCFQCETERRRHPGVPPSWVTLPDTEILSLITSAADTRLAPLSDIKAAS